MLYNFLKKIFFKKENNFSKDIFNINKKVIFGFWIYIMSDCIMFATAFSVYFVMVNNISNGPSGKDIFNLNIVELETLFLLLSSFMFSISLNFLKKNNSFMVCFFLFLVFILGFLFIFFESYEFFLLFHKNYYPTKSGFLSSFYFLLSFHGIHIIVGLIWILLMIFQIIILGINKNIITKILCLSIFWHFLDIIWIFLFTFVYLFGMIK
ncbi:MAG: cytochrome o ubiquinol oxidase subunit III [Buchnera aphidicola (Periphyllus lyropictus)]|uniref:cytochrome c oxidase subunit 3 n=1 Tax=Buchnera aphidicola TaxID=9 RepID=UPI001EC06DCB|nr:cytochrome c oxidase subunit 3 [Buchnera aphidicola]NIH16521.1 cytochrome o ubiquinol oxidase subunit III [Buchnera aphidicola (Periphyllus lyropictus)]USS94805.1 cytochrome c oxidase subunit 3 [Buchnera aphidicola (Periphyllus lyropictus)]